MKASSEMGSDGQPVDRGPASGKGFKLEAIAVFQDMNKQENIRSVQVYSQEGQYMALQQAFSLSPSAYYPLHEPVGMFFSNEAESLRFMARQKADKGWTCILDYAEYLPSPTTMNPLLSPKRNLLLKLLPTLVNDLSYVEAAVEVASQNGQSHRGPAVSASGAFPVTAGFSPWGPYSGFRGVDEMMLPSLSPHGILPPVCPEPLSLNGYSLNQGPREAPQASPRTEFISAFHRNAPSFLKPSSPLHSSHTLHPHPLDSQTMILQPTANHFALPPSHQRPPHSETPISGPLNASFSQNGLRSAQPSSYYPSPASDPTRLDPLHAYFSQSGSGAVPPPLSGSLLQQYAGGSPLHKGAGPTMFLSIPDPNSETPRASPAVLGGGPRPRTPRFGGEPSTSSATLSQTASSVDTPFSEFVGGLRPEVLQLVANPEDWAKDAAGSEVPGGMEASDWVKNAGHGGVNDWVKEAISSRANDWVQDGVSRVNDGVNGRVMSWVEDVVKNPRAQLRSKADPHVDVDTIRADINQGANRALQEKDAAWAEANDWVKRPGTQLRRKADLEANIETIRAELNRGAKRVMREKGGAPSSGDGTLLSTFQSLPPQDVSIQGGPESPPLRLDRTISSPVEILGAPALGSLARTFSEPVFMGSGEFPKSSKFEEGSRQSALTRRESTSRAVSSLRAALHSLNRENESRVHSQGLGSKHERPVPDSKSGPKEEEKVPGLPVKGPVLGGAASPGTVGTGAGSPDLSRFRPPDGFRGPMKKASKLTVEDLTPYFEMPMAEACKALGVGATILKRRCRVLKIPRWPYRKVKSIDGLIRTIQELGPNDGSASKQVEDALQRLESEKKRISETPSLGMAQETKKFRQACFKASHKIRKSGGSS